MRRCQGLDLDDTMRDTAISPVILLAFANDRDDYLPNLQRERDSLYESLQSLDDRGAIQVHKQEQTSLQGLFATLNRYADRIAIIHYAGHANGSGLQLESASGAELAHAPGLARRFAQLPALQLVFLNGCATRGQVATLLAAGVKAVIATSVKIDDAMATDFARQFYAALCAATAGVSIESAFETARAYVAARDPERRVELFRGFRWAGQSAEAVGPIWGLYTGQDASAALAWCLPATAASPTDVIIERINNGTISLDEARRLAMALGLQRSAAAASPVPADLTKSFTETVTVLFTADDPADRRAATSVIRGDDAGAYDQLFATATIGAKAASAETAAAAVRFRQAGAIAAPTSVSRAIAAYSRAADLEPAESWTWIELARLHRRRGALGESRLCAEHARDHAGNDRYRGAAENELGDIARATGDLAEARRCFTNGLSITEHFAAAEPTNTEWQRNMSVSHNKLGEIATLNADLALARRHFASSLAIRERLAAGDPANIDWQRDLSISHNKLGEIAMAVDDRAEARRRFTSSLAIRQQLVTIDPDNTEWQRDLSVSHNKLGDLAIAAGDLDEAHGRFSNSLAIRQRLVAADPSNTDWQRDLSVSHSRLGDLAQTRRDFDEARRRFSDSLTIREHLAAADPANTEWQRNLSVGHERLGDLAEAAGDIATARRHYADSLPIARALATRWPDHPQFQQDFAKTRQRLVKLGEYANPQP